MYIQDKDQALTHLEELESVLGDLMTWDAHHDDVFNEELLSINSNIQGMLDKLKTL